MSFDLKYPGFFIIVALTAVYFIVRFYLHKEELGNKNRNFLFILKYIFLSMFILLIFEPALTKISFIEKPERSLVLFDNSRSIILNDPADTILVKNAAAEILKDKSFITLYFGNGTKKLSGTDQLDFNDDFTNISDPETNDLIDDLILKNNIKSVIIFSDGNFSDADDISLKNNIPVDLIYTSVRSEVSDIFIDDIIYQDNPADGQGTDFRLIAGYKGETNSGNFTLKITENDKTIKTLSGKVPDNNSFVSLKIELPDMSSNSRELKFVIEPLVNEKNLFNNERSAYQKKLSSSDNFLIVADSPSLDLAFFSKLLKTNGYSFRTVFENSVSDSIDFSNYRALILFATPTKMTKNITIGLLDKFSSKLFFIDQKTDLFKLNGILSSGLNNFKYIPAQGRLAENKTGDGAFLLNRASVPIFLNSMPEIEYNSAFLPDETKFLPLLTISNSVRSKAIYRSGDGRSNIMIANFSSFWQLLFNDENENAGRLLLNILDQISADISRDRIGITSVKDEYYSGEKIVFKGNILDENFRSSDNAEADLIINENSLKTKFSFSKKEYSAEFFLTKPGQYSAQVRLNEAGGKTIVKDIRFKVIENDLETQTLGADTTYIKSFVRARDGVMLPISGADEFLKKYKNRTETVRSVSTISLTKNIYFFILLIIVFLVELAYRKYKDLS